MLTTVYQKLWQNESQAVFVMIGYVFHSTDVSATRSQKRVYSHVRNSSTVHKQENIVCTQVEKDFNTGVFILRTVDLTVCCYLLLLPLSLCSLCSFRVAFSSSNLLVSAFHRI